MATDNDKPHNTHDLLTEFRTLICGCVDRGDGVNLTICPRHNPRRGTHGKEARKYA